MEAIQLLSFILAIIIVSLAQYRRRRSTARSLRQPTIKIRDAAVARQALIEQADVFSNRPVTPFPVPLITGRRRRSQSHGLTTVPYGPHWRALRSSLNAAMLQPWRLGLLAPLQQDAVDAHIAGLGAGDVVIRHKLYPAVFSMLARVCFGDDVDARHVRYMERMMLEFTAAIAEAKVFARSTMARLWHWTDPDEFRPERFLPGGEGEDVGPVPAGPKEIRMMPFGAGQRACPGASMAVQFIKDFLAPLVREFEWTAAALPMVGEEGSGSADGGGVDMTKLYGFITKMKSPLRAHITPRA